MKTISGLTSGTIYYVRAKATSTTAPESPYTETLTLIPGGLALAAPNVSATSTKTSVVLKIDAVPNADAYLLEYGTSPDFVGAKTKIYSTEGAKTISGLTFGTLYYFRVKATSNSEDVRDSEWTTLARAAGQLNDVSASILAVDVRSITLKVVAVTGASGYAVELATNSQFDDSSIFVDESAGTITVGELNPSTQYYLRVKALGDDVSRVDSAWTEPLVATTLDDTPTLDAPSVQASSNSDSITFDVAPVSGASALVLQYSLDPNFANAIERVGTFGATTISNLTPDTIYYFRVKAIGEGALDSDWTVGCVATLPVLEPLDVPTISLSGTKTAVVVKISAVDDAQKYVVEYSTDANFATFSTKTYSSSGVKTISGLTSGTWYYVRAKATATGRADSEYCVKSKIYTGGQLAMPVVSASAIKTSITLNIKPVTNGEKYVVEYGENEDFSNAKTKTFNSGVRTITGLTFATKYYFRVKATGSAANDSMWNVLSYSAGQLATPKTYATSVGSDLVVVKSYNSANASGYEVRYSTSPDFSNAQYATCGATSSCRVDGLTPKTKYYFSARALGDNVSRVNSNWSTSFSATTKEGAPALNAPTLSCSANSTELDLVIGAVPNATRYVLEYGTSPNFSSATSVSLSSPGALSLADLNPGTTYYVRVKATAANYLDSPWASASATTTAASPVPPTVAVTPNKTSIVLKINPVDGAAKYVLEYGTDPSFATCATKTYTTSGAKTLSGLASGTTYYFRVKATATGVADSEWNEFQARTTGLAAPSVSASVTKSAVVLNIGSVDGAESYLVEYGTDSSFASSSTKTYPSSGVKTISGLTSGTTYYFRVKATSSSQGESSWTTLTAKTTAATSSAILDDSFEDPFDLELDDSLDALANSLAKSRSNKR